MSLSEVLAVAMLAVLALALFSGLPVAIVLMAVGFAFGGLAISLGLIRAADFGAIYFRVYGALTDSDEILYAAVPLLILMGSTPQKTGLATDLLLGVQKIKEGAAASRALCAALLSDQTETTRCLAPSGYERANNSGMASVCRV